MINYFKEIAFDFIQHYLNTYDQPRHLEVKEGQLVLRDSDIALWELLSELGRGYSAEDIADSFQIPIEKIFVGLTDLAKLLQEPVKITLPPPENGIRGIVNLIKDTILKKLEPR